MNDKLFNTERLKWQKELGEVKTETMNSTITVQNSAIDVGLIIKRVVDEVANKALSAGLGGHHHDGGARELMKTLNAWIAGYEQTTPSSFGKVLLTLQKEENPEEYAEYLRLKKVFGD